MYVHGDRRQGPTIQTSVQFCDFVKQHLCSLFGSITFELCNLPYFLALFPAVLIDVPSLLFIKRRKVELVFFIKQISCKQYSHCRCLVSNPTQLHTVHLILQIWIKIKRQATQLYICYKIQCTSLPGALLCLKSFLCCGFFL